MTSKTNITIREIADALANDEFVFYYQPKVSMHTGEICGAEALIRWQRPNGEMISPAEFIPLAESTGFINEITLAMFQKLIVDLNIIIDINESLIVSFNASAKDFHNNKLSTTIQHAVEHHLLAAKHLEVELTETVILDQVEEVRDNLSLLHDLGIALAMDDYGTGFSSIDTLSKWPFSTIKLDQGMVSKLGTSEKDFTIIHSSIQMAHQLELEIVAEGIETEVVYRILQNMGCVIAQGYWISRPVSLVDFIEFCRRNKCWPSQSNGVIHMAILDHIQWRKSLIDGVYYISLRRNIQGLRGTPEINPTLCKFGKWYHGLGRRCAGEKWYDEIETPHNRLHEIGEELLVAAQRNAPQNEIALLMRQLTEQSILVIGMLQSVENELMTKSKA